MKRTTLLLVSLLLLGCSSTDKNDSPIGTATMQSDGTIVLNLISETGSAIGHAQFSYTSTDEKYSEIINHLGGLKPGEEKLVPPWTEEE